MAIGTIHVGKAHFGPNGSNAEEPKNLGFDINVAGRGIGAPGSYYGEKKYGNGTKRRNHAVPHLEKYHGTETFLTEALTLEAQTHVAKSVADDKPFYLYFSHYAVHAPFNSDPRFADHYKDSGKPKKAQAFATLIEGMDKSLNDMLDQFEKLGIAENTLIFFLGDNGTDADLGHQHAVACAAPLRGKKGTHYEGGMRVPFIAAWGKANPQNAFQKKLPIPRQQTPKPDCFGDGLVSYPARCGRDQAAGKPQGRWIPSENVADWCGTIPRIPSNFSCITHTEGTAATTSPHGATAIGKSSTTPCLMNPFTVAAFNPMAKITSFSTSPTIHLNRPISPIQSPMS